MGAYQRQNAALAVAAARTLLPEISSDTIEQGLARLKWPGRFEVINSIVLDGAHNDASAEALAQTLTGYASDRSVTLVVGINRDKDARAVLRPLVTLANNVIATRAAGNPRALSGVEVARLCRRLGVTATVEDDLATALAHAKADQDNIVCVTGSLMLVGQARALLGLPTPEQLW
jgi:dihydrofolate synthase/folylpolyglutamate synthase